MFGENNSVMKTILAIISLLFTATMFAQNATNHNEVPFRIVAHKTTDNAVISVSNEVEVTKKLNIQVPNAFSPDGDGVNDDFMVVHDGVEHFTMDIYNRWGELVYHTDDTELPWDGLHKGKDCQQDAYIYVISARGLDDESATTLKGTVSLIR
jgi:gliding motility-associated-like protein